MKYDFAAIEPKWQKKWLEEKTYHCENHSDKPKFYGLVEFPYPSGQGLHVGHARPYTCLLYTSKSCPYANMEKTLGVFMELTSKQRAQLRGLANTIDTIVHVGKDGLGENLVKQADDALEAREIIKCKVLENSEFTPREAAEALAKATRSEVVQVIGTKFVLYRQSHNKEKKDKIVLVKDKKQ